MGMGLEKIMELVATTTWNTSADEPTRISDELGHDEHDSQRSEGGEEFFTEMTLSDAVHDYLDFHSADELRTLVEGLIGGNGV
jgi:hypothetical protein